MLDGLFDARRVAVIGVSPRPSNLGRVIISNMHRFHFKGEALAVGHQGGETEFGPIYKTLEEVPGQVDLAVVMVPARFVLETIEACGRKRVPWAVISSAGFGELGGEGMEIQRRVLETARRHGTRFIGPNCLGVTDWVSGLTTSFASVPLYALNRGPVSVISQSGGVADAISSFISELSLGLNKFISIGNSVDVDEVDSLAYLAEDPSTKVICMYLEGIWRGRELLQTARRCHKPILMIKANRSTSGARAAESHTAALASNERVVESALTQSRVVRVNGIRNMALASAALLLPKMQGNRVAAMSLSGGLSVILADLCEELGFSLPLLDQNLLDDIEAGSRAGIIRLTNPLDTGDIFDNKLFVETVRRVISLPYVDAMIVGFPLRDSRPGETTRSESYHVARGVVEICRSVGKPIALSKMPSPKPIAGLMRDLDFPVFSDPEEATRALGVLWRYSQLSR